MKLTRPSRHAKSVHIGLRFTGEHKLTMNSETGELSECLPPIEGSAAFIQQVLITPLPTPKPSLASRVGKTLRAVASYRRPLLNPRTGVMR
jgi:hypothetical protein